MKSDLISFSHIFFMSVSLAIIITHFVRCLVGFCCLSLFCRWFSLPKMFILTFQTCWTLFLWCLECFVSTHIISNYSKYIIFHHVALCINSKILEWPTTNSNIDLMLHAHRSDSILSSLNGMESPLSVIRRW